MTIVSRLSEAIEVRIAACGSIAVGGLQSQNRPSFESTTPLAPDAHNSAFPAYQQFLHLGEAGLAASIYFVVVSRNLAPEAARQNWSASKALEVFESRLGLVTRQLAHSPYLAGDTFTAADISVTYALELAQRGGGIALGEAERAYVVRTSARDAYKRAMETCHATRAWAAEASRR